MPTLANQLLALRQQNQLPPGFSPSNVPRDSLQILLGLGGPASPFMTPDMAQAATEAQFPQTNALMTPQDAQGFIGQQGAGINQGIDADLGQALAWAQPGGGFRQALADMRRSQQTGYWNGLHTGRGQGSGTDADGNPLDRAPRGVDPEALAFAQQNLAARGQGQPFDLPGRAEGPTAPRPPLPEDLERATADGLNPDTLDYTGGRLQDQPWYQDAIAAAQDGVNLPAIQKFGGPVEEGPSQEEKARRLAAYHERRDRTKAERRANLVKRAQMNKLRRENPQAYGLQQILGVVDGMTGGEGGMDDSMRDVMIGNWLGDPNYAKNQASIRLAREQTATANAERESDREFQREQQINQAVAAESALPENAGLSPERIRAKVLAKYGLDASGGLPQPQPGAQTNQNVGLPDRMVSQVQDIEPAEYIRRWDQQLLQMSPEDEAALLERLYPGQWMDALQAPKGFAGILGEVTNQADLQRRMKRAMRLGVDPDTGRPLAELTDEEVSQLKPEWKEAANRERAKLGLPPVTGPMQNPSLGQMFWGWMDS